MLVNPKNLDYEFGMAARYLDTTKAVMDALGGHIDVATLTRRKIKAAWNWYKFPHFPPDTYVVMRDALARRGCTAPRSLWRMVEPPPNPPSPDF